MVAVQDRGQQGLAGSRLPKPGHEVVRLGLDPDRHHALRQNGRSDFSGPGGHRRADGQRLGRSPESAVDRG